jgi:Asp/Glu/hydantoin racemase
MNVFHVRKGVEAYGYEIGVLLVNCKGTPFIPGDVGNVSTYDFPVLYKTVPELTLARLLEQDDFSLAKPIIEAAISLESSGVKAITSDCGYMIKFQKHVAEAVKIPVILSSLLQVPMLLNTLGNSGRIGIICANKERLTSDLLKRSAITDTDRTVICGLEEMPSFRSAILEESGILNYNAIEKEVLQISEKLVSQHKSVRIIVLECSNLPPYACAIQKATGLPVFDFTSLINYVHMALHRFRFSGTY